MISRNHGLMLLGITLLLVIASSAPTFAQINNGTNSTAVEPQPVVTQPVVIQPETLGPPEEFPLVELGPDWEKYLVGENETASVYKTVIYTGQRNVLDTDGKYKPYTFSDDGTTVKFGSVGVAFTYNKNSCGFKFYEGGKVPSGTPVVNWYGVSLKETLNGTADWVDGAVNNEICDTDIQLTNDGVIITTIKENTDGVFKITYDADRLMGLEDTYEYTNLNPSKNDYKYGFTTVIESNSDIKVGEQIIEKSTVTDTLTLYKDDISGAPITFENGEKDYKFDTKDVVHNTLLLQRVQPAKDVFDFTNINQPLKVGQKISVDPTFISSNPAVDGYIEDTGTNNICDGDTLSKSTVDINTGYITRATGDSSDCRRSFYEFGISAIPFNAVPTGVAFITHTNTATSAYNVVIKEMKTSRPSTATNSQIWTDMGDGTTYITSSLTASTGTQQRLDLGPSAVADLLYMLKTNQWFAFSTIASTETLDATAHLSLQVSEEGTGDPDPTLEVTYVLIDTTPGKPTGLNSYVVISPPTIIGNWTGCSFDGLNYTTCTQITGVRIYNSTDFPYAQMPLPTFGKNDTEYNNVTGSVSMSNTDIYYNFDELSNSINFTDSSGNGKDATMFSTGIRDGFSTSAGWTEVGTTWDINSGKMKAVNVPANAEHRMYKLMNQTLPASTWRLDLDGKITADGSDSGLVFYITDSTAFMPSGDALGFSFQNENPGPVKRIRLRAIEDGVQTNAAGVLYVVGTQYYFTLERTTPYMTSLSVFSDAARTSHVSGSPMTLEIAVTENPTGGTSGFTLYSTGALKRGEKAETSNSILIGKIPSEVSFWLRKVGSPTGTLTVTHRASDDTLKHTFGTLDVSTLTGSFVETTFISTGVAIAENDRILAEYSGGDVSNYVEMDAKETTNPYDSTNSVASYYTTSWTDASASDIKFSLKYANGITGLNTMQFSSFSYGVSATASGEFDNVNLYPVDGMTFTDANTVDGMFNNTVVIRDNTLNFTTTDPLAEGTNNFSMGSWVRTNNTSGFDLLSFNKTGPAKTQIGFNQTYVYVKVDGNDICSKAVTISQGKWQYINIDRNGNTFTMTHNSTSSTCSSSASLGTALSDVFYIGTNDKSLPLGNIDEYYIKSQSDTPQIQNIFNRGNNTLTDLGLVSGNVTEVQFDTAVGNNEFYRVSLTNDEDNDDFSNSTIWTKVGTTIEVTGGQVVATNVPRNAEHRVYKPLGFTLGDNDKWTWKFDINVTKLDASFAEISLALTSDTTFAPSSLDSLGLSIVENSGKKLRPRSHDDGSTATGTEITFSLNTKYYITMERTSPVNFRMNVFSDAARTTHISGSPVNFAIPSTITGLDVIQVSSNNAGVSALASGTFDNSIIDAHRVGEIPKIYSDLIYGSIGIPPDAPTLADPADGFPIILNWTPGDNNGFPIDYYKIERKQGFGSYSVLVANTGNVTSYNDSTCTLSLNYTYRVYAHNIGGFSPASNEGFAICGIPPDAPTGLTAVIQDPVSFPLRIKLDWNAVTYWGTGTQQGYTVHRSSNNGSSYDILAHVNNALTLTDNVPFDGNWYYKVSANSTHGQNFTGPVNMTTPTEPGAPTGLTTTRFVNELTKILLQWATPADDGGTPILGYTILRASPPSGNYTPIALVGVVNAYNDTSVSIHTSYGYKVKAFNIIGNGTESNQSNIDTYTNPPTNVKANTGVPDCANNLCNIHVMWDAPTGVPGLNGYKIERMLHNNGTWFILVANTTTTDVTYEDNSRPNATRHDYRITTLKGIFVSPPSASAGNYTSFPPTPPLNLVALPLANDAGFELLWDTPTSPGNATITGYKIERNINGGAFSTLVADTGVVNSYTDSAVSAGNTYQYRIYAISSVGLSGKSNTVNASFLAGSLVISASSTLAKNIDITPTVTVTFGEPLPVVVSRTLYSGSGVLQSVTDGATVLNLGSNTLPVFTDYTLYSRPYTVVVVLRNGEAAQSLTLTSNTVLGTPLIGDCTSLCYIENRNENFTASTINVTKLPQSYNLTLVYRAADGTDTFTRNFFNVNGITSAEDLAVKSNIDYYISGYINPTFTTSGTGIGSTATIPSGYPSTFTHISKKAPGTPNPTGLEPLGTLFGMPLVFIFIIALGSIFTPRSAPMGLLIVGVALGMMTYLGYVNFDFDPANQSTMITWILIIIAIAVGLLVGKRYD